MKKLYTLFLFVMCFHVLQAQQATDSSKNFNSNLSSADTCLLLAKLLPTSWRLNTKEKLYIDTAGILFNKSFRNCLLSKSRDEIIKLLGYPNIETIHALKNKHFIGYRIHKTQYNPENNRNGIYLEMELDKNKKLRHLKVRDIDDSLFQ